MKRMAGCHEDAGCVAISALRTQSLLPLLEQIGKMLSKDLMTSHSEGATVSRARWQA
jgi:hypothetical protein